MFPFPSFFWGGVETELQPLHLLWESHKRLFNILTFSVLDQGRCLNRRVAEQSNKEKHSQWIRSDLAFLHNQTPFSPIVLLCINAHWFDAGDLSRAACWTTAAPLGTKGVKMMDGWNVTVWFCHMVPELFSFIRCHKTLNKSGLTPVLFVVC